MWNCKAGLLQLVFDDVLTYRLKKHGAKIARGHVWSCLRVLLWQDIVWWISSDMFLTQLVQQLASGEGRFKQQSSWTSESYINGRLYTDRWLFFRHLKDRCVKKLTQSLHNELLRVETVERQRVVLNDLPNQGTSGKSTSFRIPDGGDAAAVAMAKQTKISKDSAVFWGWIIVSDNVHIWLWWSSRSTGQKILYCKLYHGIYQGQWATLAKQIETLGW